MGCCDLDDIWECEFCGTQFEKDVADPGPNGEPRCPQCLLYRAHRVEGDRIGEFVVTRGTRFR